MKDRCSHVDISYDVDEISCRAVTANEERRFENGKGHRRRIRDDHLRKLAYVIVISFPGSCDMLNEFTSYRGGTRL
jgi:hypothetical protein